MQIPNTPLFVKTHDFNVWLIRHTQRFPKNLRASLSLRIENAALEFQELLMMANSSRDVHRNHYLEQADGRLLGLRVLLRYTIDFELLGSGQYEFASKSLEELGRLLGAWRKVSSR